MSTDRDMSALSTEELAAQGGTALPDKEVMSVLDLNADLDLAIDAAAPIDLAVAANANVAAPIDAAVGANILSSGSEAQALSDQGVMIDQAINADATANAEQDSVLDQSNDTIDDGSGTDAVSDGVPPPAGDVTTTPTAEGVMDGGLLNIDVNLAADADIAAPINGAVAANANVAAPIDAAVAANIGSIDSSAVAVAEQDAIINQSIEGEASANSEQTSDIRQ